MKTPVGLLALAGALLLPQKLAAQACLGAPSAGRAWLGARVARTSLDANLAGAEGGVRIAGAFTVRAQGDRVGFDDQTPTRWRGFGGLVVGSREWRIPACFTASVMITRLGDLSIVTVPIGIAGGWEIPLGRRARGEQAAGAGTGTKSNWTSYVEPRLAYRRASLKGFYDVSAPFSIVGGTGFKWGAGRIYSGVDLEWSPSESRTWAVGLRAAVGF